MVKEICYKINKSSMLYKRLMSKHLERLGITYAQLMVLKVINNEPGITAKEILVQMDTDKATLSGVISRLERDNYIFRVKNDKDRRVQNIYLAGGSAEICSEVEIIENTCIYDLVKGFDEAETEMLVTLLDRFISNQFKKLADE